MRDAVVELDGADGIDGRKPQQLAQLHAHLLRVAVGRTLAAQHQAHIVQLLDGRCEDPCRHR